MGTRCFRGNHRDRSRAGIQIQSRDERTFLAWIRTELGLQADGIAVDQFFISENENNLHILLGMICAVMASAIVLGAHRHWEATQTAMRRDHPLPKSPMIPLVVGGVCLITGLSIGMTVLRRTMNVRGCNPRERCSPGDSLPSPN
ncbi:YidH family protein [Rhodococcus sp. P-2]|uniref:YidH family protein n=1 Tax=Rhodococcus sp. P-2 TaxID=2795031 RepID=UPI001F471E8B|nr:DUF202 domain-containing protein [Rhodococcus sp. P-2]